MFRSHAEAEKADLEYWLALTPQERLDAVRECVIEYLRMRNEPEPGFQRVHRVLERKGR